MPSQSGVERDALANSGRATTQATSAYNAVSPIYAEMASGTDGLTAQQKSDALTASSQSLGGGVASAVGQGGLLAARTNNAGGATAALDDAAHQSQKVQSGNALDVENQSTELAHRNQQIGLSGLSGIYSDANQTQNGALNTAANAPRPFWQQLALAGTAAAGQALTGK